MHISLESDEIEGSKVSTFICCTPAVPDSVRVSDDDMGVKHLAVSQSDESQPVQKVVTQPERGTSQNGVMEERNEIANTMPTPSMVPQTLSDDNIDDQWTPVKTREDGRLEFWSNLVRISRTQTVPWLVIGDFNSVLNPSDKLGGQVVESNKVSDFRNYAHSCMLTDMKYDGCFYTWSNKQEGSEKILCKLDRALVNEQWIQLWLDTVTHFIQEGVSDHSPALVAWGTM
ncbi:hypothetical protein RIF29_20764 [Crotalaria pallida]|uniref:Uncharacterized protein n=1 Tax=Crotalaria pallida TaxID=3830 RepID=A0AAN9F647_CROPI